MSVPDFVAGSCLAFPPWNSDHSCRDQSWCCRVTSARRLPCVLFSFLSYVNRISFPESLMLDLSNYFKILIIYEHSSLFIFSHVFIPLFAFPEI